MTSRTSVTDISRLLSGERLTRVVDADPGLVIEFTGGLSLTIESRDGTLTASIRRLSETDGGSGRPRATRRQQEYLDFMAKFIARFGVAPAESDIQRHFLVSAPSVNQMVRTLERRGFITRKRDKLGYVVPRSIRVVEPR